MSMAVAASASPMPQVGNPVELLDNIFDLTVGNSKGWAFLGEASGGQNDNEAQVNAADREDFQFRAGLIRESFSRALPLELCRLVAEYGPSLSHRLTAVSMAPEVARHSGRSIREIAEGLLSVRRGLPPVFREDQLSVTIYTGTVITSSQPDLIGKVRFIRETDFNPNYEIQNQEKPSNRDAELALLTSTRGVMRSRDGQETTQPQPDGTIRIVTPTDDAGYVQYFGQGDMSDQVQANYRCFDPALETENLLWDWSGRELSVMSYFTRHTFSMDLVSRICRSVIISKSYANPLLEICPRPLEYTTLSDTVKLRIQRGNSWSGLWILRDYFAPHSDSGEKTRFSAAALAPVAPPPQAAPAASCNVQ